MVVTSEIVWVPSNDLVEHSNVKRFMDKHNVRTYRELLDWSVEDNEWFWDAALKDLGVEWYKPYRKILDTSEGVPWAKWFIGGKINISHNCLDRHAKSSRRNKVACMWESDDGAVRKMTYWDLYMDANKVANAIEEHGVRKGEVVGLYMPMVPEIVIIMYACFKVGAICLPIFSGYGPSAVATRLRDAEAKMVFTADGFLRRGKTIELKKKADAAVDMTDTVEKLVVFSRLGIDVPWHEGRDIWLHDLLGGRPKEYPTRWMNSEDASLILYSSGTTGRPKGTVHTHAGCLAQMTKEIGYGFDLKTDDIFFWMTDIGWMMGPWMIIGCHNFGGTIFMFEGVPDYPTPDRLWDMVKRHRITILGVSPTVIRMLMRYGTERLERHDLSTLRILGSTGEPWDHDSWMWYFKHVGGRKCPVINISGGTEIVGCFLFPLPIMPQKPCTLGHGPALGMDVDVLDDEGKPVRDEKGYLVCKKPAPSMTKGFWKEPQRYIETYWSRWPNIWYHGDWASVDEDGFWYLHGRTDDVIKVAGRRVGPAEIEEILIEHPAVSEAAVIGAPHEVKGEEIVAFVVLNPKHQPTEELRSEIKDHVIEKLGKTLRPADLKFLKALPKTRTGKIVRAIIKAKYLRKKDLGDLTSIENPDAIDEIEKAF